jgi:hypothetical protein
MADDRSFERLASLTEDGSDGGRRASAKLKSRIYSSIVSELAADGPLLSLAAVKEGGHRLCVFEHTVALMPGESLKAKNPCRVCHARVLAERLEHAPIFWPGCPYCEFHNG